MIHCQTPYIKRSWDPVSPGSEYIVMYFSTKMKSEICVSGSSISKHLKFLNKNHCKEEEKCYWFYKAIQIRSYKWWLYWLLFFYCLMQLLDPVKVRFRAFLILRNIIIASLVQKLQQLCWICGFCLLVELHLRIVLFRKDNKLVCLISIKDLEQQQPLNTPSNFYQV